jgi:glucans biosynthesis protein
MYLPIARRTFLMLGASFMTALAGEIRPALARSAAGVVLGAPQPFSFDRLVTRARDLARRAFEAPEPKAADLIQTIDFDAVQKIKFRKECAVAQGSRYPIRFFHLNEYVQTPVVIHVVRDGIAQPLIYTKDCFEVGDPDLARALPDDLGYSGFRVMDGPDTETDWLAFQGASYFRSSGSSNQYGTSARGLAIDTAMPQPEEFPRFSQFWLQETPDASGAVTLFALLEGPSVTGAYRFEARREHAPVMDVHAELFFRSDVARLGIAPLTSMYWYGENSVSARPDWRPEIHDCDGLAVWTGSGERLWRPLTNPPRVLTNSFVDRSPKGFGLLQRDHDFNNYQDDGAFYNKRPSVWIEPVGDWGEGAVQLVQIPTDDEIHDNVVAYWTPKDPVRAGQNRTFDYRIYWQDDEPYPPKLARVVATRIGRGGVPGRPSPENRWKFVIDFVGGPLSTMQARYDIKPMVTPSRGEIKNGYSIKVVGTDRWRCFFDLAPADEEPVELRCYLRLGEQTLSETWSYEFFPDAYDTYTRRVTGKRG